MMEKNGQSCINYDWDELIRRASSGSYPLPSIDSAASASAFASWVYVLSHPESIKPGNRSEQTFSAAKAQEIRIAALMAGFEGLKPSQGTRLRASGWELVYSDPLVGSGAANWFEGSRLGTDGEHIHCRPDVVLLNRSTRQLLIVERKVAVTAASSIPDECYPNVLAQLWCYAHINLEKTGWDIPRNVSVLLGAELWSHSRFESPDDGRLRYWIWCKEDHAFRYVPTLFQLYGKEVVARSKHDED
jgi:hypothetical protein